MEEEPDRSYISCVVLAVVLAVSSLVVVLLWVRVTYFGKFYFSGLDLNWLFGAALILTPFILWINYRHVIAAETFSDGEEGILLKQSWVSVLMPFSLVIWLWTGENFIWFLFSLSIGYVGIGSVINRVSIIGNHSGTHKGLSAIINGLIMLLISTIISFSVFYSQLIRRM